MKQETWSMESLKLAWELATRAHDGQKYGGGAKGEMVEYLNHIGTVVFEIMNALNHEPGHNADLAVQCAVLHDVIEDSPVTYDDVLAQFGKATADGVSALTKDESLPDKSAQMKDSLRRIKEQPKEVWMTKMADRITNLYMPPHYWSTEKRKNYQAEGQLIHDELHAASPFLAARLQEKIDDYAQYF